jgi:hypothetical protein
MTDRPTPPSISPQDRERGRDRALAHRRERAAIKAEVRAGTLTGAEVVHLAARDDDRGRIAARMRIGELLLSIPGVGPATAERALVAAGISGQRRLGQLGPRQVQQLAGLL